MRRLPIFFTILFILSSLYGCINISREKPTSESTFFVNFSLGSIIEANEENLILKGTVDSHTILEPPTSFFQKEEVATIQIDPADIPGFMNSVRSDIDEALTNSGVNILGRGGVVGLPADLQGFSVRYSEDGSEGVINLWGVRGEGTTFYLIALITES
jgi:hypothetical protein